MTTILITRSQNEYAKTTSNAASPCLMPEFAVSQTTSDMHLISDVVMFSASLHRELPRRVSRREKRESLELKDPSFRARVIAARKALAVEYEHVLPTRTLAMLRLERGLSQKQLALMMRTTQPYIAKIEAGGVRLLFETAGKLADALEISLDELRAIVPCESKPQNLVVSSV